MAIALNTPLILVDDDDLLRVSRENSAYCFERESDGTIIVSPHYTNGGRKSGEVYGQLRDYGKLCGGQAFDSSTGFHIGPGKRTWAPDASWVSQARIDALTAQQKVKYWPISPDVAIEVKSETDDFAETVERIEIFMECGSRYAVAINPQTREVQQRGTPPPRLELDFDAIIDA
jgi:Uma2 family endonuclease